MRGEIAATANRRWLHATLLLLTLASTFATFRARFGGGSADPRAQLFNSACFSLALVLILGTHEMGHYLFARRHGVSTSLPYFIPLPFLGVGTLGAVIRLRSPIPNRNALVDIGASGPLAGLAVAMVVYALGLSLSPVVEVPHLASHFPAEGSLWSMASALVRGSSESIFGEEAGVSTVYWIFGNNLLTLGLRALLVGPLPVGYDTFDHPLVIAGWFGMLVTVLNLMPIGQLDGGHVSFALFGKWARSVGSAAAAGLLYLATFYSASWLIWLLLVTALVRFRHPPVTDGAAPLTRGRRRIAVLCGAALLLCLIPVPLRLVWAR